MTRAARAASQPRNYTAQTVRPAGARIRDTRRLTASECTGEDGGTLNEHRS